MSICILYIYREREREREGGREFCVSLQFCRGLCNLQCGKLLKTRAAWGLLSWHAPTSLLYLELHTWTKLWPISQNGWQRQHRVHHIRGVADSEPLVSNRRRAGFSFEAPGWSFLCKQAHRLPWCSTWRPRVAIIRP